MAATNNTSSINSPALDGDTCYRAMLAHDGRFDGRFFVAVSSTRIYCRPICRVRMPKRENCTFHRSAAAAESFGYRPCLKCRPELAPGWAATEAGNRLAQRAAFSMDSGEFDQSSLRELAGKLGATDRHLRRVFNEHFGVSPIQYAQTHRMLLAKQLLTDTRLDVTEIAFAAGFRSLRRFNALFKGRYRLTPSQLRREGRPMASDRLTFRLAYRAPLDWSHLLSFLKTRVVEAVEVVEADQYARTVQFPAQGWLVARPVKDRSLIEVELSVSLAAHVSTVLRRLRHVFDLDCSPDLVAQALGPLAQANPGIRLPGAWDGFELAVRAVLGQQITVKAARTLAGRFAKRFGDPLTIDTPIAGLGALFPTAKRIADCTVADIAELGIISSRARSLIALAQAIDQGKLLLAPGADVESSLAQLLSLPGIGDWTAQYIAMRALAWPDAFPASDLVVMKALSVSRPKQAEAIAEAWRPWRAYSVIHLWNQAK
jgi:AraC family transcriptional regulator, regulatory protein of adaptative response / DNA-3-methyladenine glycosylase II